MESLHAEPLTEVPGPGLPELLRLGIAAARAGSRETARSAFLEAAPGEIAPDWLRVWRAVVAGTADEARLELLDVLGHDPDHEGATRLLAALEPLQPLDPPGLAICPVCAAVHASGFPRIAGAFRCLRCKAVTQLSDLEPLLTNGELDRPLAVASLGRTVELSMGGTFDHLLLSILNLNLGRRNEAVPHLDAVSEAGLEKEAVARILARLRPAPAGAPPSQRAPSVATPAAQAGSRRRTILVVDDSPTARKIAAIALERNGFSVISAGDGVEALSRLDETVPDLVLLDVSMPNMDGYQLCKFLKEGERTRDVPVVMLSGKDKFVDKMKGRAAGAVDYLTKPFDPGVLVRTVEAHLAPARTE